MKNTASLTLILLAFLFSQCSTDKKTIQSSKDRTTMEHKTIMEITTFNINPNVDANDFKVRDLQIEEDYTSKQPGFIKRQSGVNDKGEYVVVVYWKSTADADASMSKFMGDESVVDYAQMMNGSSMKMSRYTMDKDFDAPHSNFVELMTFDLKDGVDLANFNSLNRKIETDVTGKRKGFAQRLTGVNEEGKQTVAIYWTSKQASDAALQPFMDAAITGQFMSNMVESSIWMGRYDFLNQELSNKDKAVALLNTFNTGEQGPIAYINPNKYIQHNLSVGDGLAGFGAVMQNAPPQGFKANVIRAFEDGDYVFTHTEYDFYGPKAGFDIFRFEKGLIVEHWDNLLEVQKPNPSGRTQFDGATEITDIDKTEVNKRIVREFIEKVLISHEMDKVTSYINPTEYLQHNPGVADGLDGFGAALKFFTENGMVMEYDKLHMVMGEGDFVLSVSEGKFGKGDHTAFYDLFRLEDGQIVEHWDVIASIPPKSEWKNDNGKF